jgi:hypothetical protein
VQRQRHPPPRRKPEEVEEELRDPGAGRATAIGDGSAGAAEEGARVAAVVGREGEREIEAGGEEEDPAGFAQDPREARVERVLVGYYSDGGSSLLMRGSPTCWGVIVLIIIVRAAALC